jgi:hypothetical protein
MDSAEEDLKKVELTTGNQGSEQNGTEKRRWACQRWKQAVNTNVMMMMNLPAM